MNMWRGDGQAHATKRQLTKPLDYRHWHCLQCLLRACACERSDYLVIGCLVRVHAGLVAKRLKACGPGLQSAGGPWCSKQLREDYVSKRTGGSRFRPQGCASRGLCQQAERARSFSITANCKATRQVQDSSTHDPACSLKTGFDWNCLHQILHSGTATAASTSAKHRAGSELSARFCQQGK